MAMQALVLGFGGSGAHVLTYLKELAVFKYGKLPDSMRFLQFDTIADWQPGGTVKISGGRGEERIAQARAAGENEGGLSLDPTTEYFHLRDHRPSLADYANNLLGRPDAAAEHPQLTNWLHAPWLNANIANDKLNVAEGAAQQRQIGRFSIFQNARTIVDILRTRLNEVGRETHNAPVNVWIVGSSAGGTGAGCMLDAALLTRLAAGNQTDNTKLRVSAVIVMPEVYSGLSGISEGRAYALFRELDRMQRRSFNHAEDRYYSNSGKQVDLEVEYGSGDALRASIDNVLFDNVFCVGRKCSNENQRVAFFSSVVSSMDPFIDENSGPTQLERAVNEDFSSPVSFGATRLYIPMKTYEELFAWEETLQWLTSLTATNDDGGVGSGPARERKDRATERVRQLLPFFGQLQGVADQPRDAQIMLLETLSPRSIATQSLLLGAASAADMQATQADLQDLVPLVYANPLLSDREDDEADVPAEERIVKTYKEARKAGVKEDQLESAQRFARELQEQIRRYKDSAGAAGSFVSGRRKIQNILRAVLCKMIDQDLQHALESENTAVAFDALETGTGLTRLHQELMHLVTTNDGIVTGMQAVLRAFVQHLEGLRSGLTDEATAALNDLTEARPGLLGGLSNWVDGHQQEARDRWTDEVRHYQKTELLRLVLDLLDDVRNRYAAWHKEIETILHQLAMRGADLTPVLRQVRNGEIGRLKTRLANLADDRNALISLAPAGERDTTMQQFSDRLRQQACVGNDGLRVSAAAMNGVEWRASITDGGSPVLSLQVPYLENQTEITGKDFGTVHERLSTMFRRRIARTLEEQDIFDYLDFAAREANVGPEGVIERLNDACSVLIEAGAASERPSVKLVYRRSRDNEDKQKLARALQEQVARINNVEADDPVDNHSDPYSLTLLKVIKPEPQSIQDLLSCRTKYLTTRHKPLGGSAKEDIEVRRARVYHVFRGELEAWNVERYAQRVSGNHDLGEFLLAPRLVRLMDEPARMKAFVDAVAADLIVNNGDHWEYRDPRSDAPIALSGRPRLIEAAVTFCLQKREYGGRSIAQIDLKSVNAAIAEKAQQQDLRKSELVRNFVNGDALPELLRENIPARDDIDENAAQTLRNGLLWMFRFYGDPEIGVELRDRI